MKEIRRCLRTVSWSDSGLPRVCTIFEGTSELLDVADRFTGGSRRYDVQSHVLLLDHYLGAVAARVFPFCIGSARSRATSGNRNIRQKPTKGGDQATETNGNLRWSAIYVEEANHEAF